MRNKKPLSFNIKRESKGLKFRHKRKLDWVDDLYRSAEWKRYRKDYLALNSFCSTPGCDQKATVIDHKKSVKRGSTVAEIMRLFWDRTNHDPKCRSCHNRKTALVDGGFGRERV